MNINNVSNKEIDSSRPVALCLDNFNIPIKLVCLEISINKASLLGYYVDTRVELSITQCHWTLDTSQVIQTLETGKKSNL